MRVNDKKVDLAEHGKTHRVISLYCFKSDMLCGLFAKYFLCFKFAELFSVDLLYCVCGVL